MRPALILLAMLVAPRFGWCTPDNLSVAGVVVDSKTHAPIRDMRVTLAPTTARDAKAELFTGEDGKFSFPVVNPGKYSLAVWKPGYPLQSYRQSAISVYSTAIVVAEAQDTRHIVFEAHRGAAISGLIQDEEGEPVARALVALYRSAISNGERTVVSVAQARANASGEFRFHNLRRGSYYICAMGRPWFADSIIQADTSAAAMAQPRRPRPAAGVEANTPEFESQLEISPDPGFRGTAFVTTFYPAARTIESATTIPVDVGGEARVQMVLPFAHAVSVKGQIVVPSAAATGRVVLHKKVYKHFLPFLDGETGADGRFELSNIPPGSYELVASSASSSGASSWIIRQVVEVGSSDLELKVSALPKGAFSGKVRFDGEAPAKQPVMFVSVESEADTDRAEVAADGTFTVAGLPAGHYTVIPRSPNYTPAYLVGPNGEKLPLAIDIAPGATVQNDIVWTEGVAVIDGVVEDKGSPAVGAFVVLVPKDTAKRLNFRADQTDSDGSFRLATIPPGDYFLVALSQEESVTYRDAKVAAILSRAGQPIHVEDRAKLELKVQVVENSTLKLPGE